MATIADLAQEIYMELGEPTDTSVPAIAYWLRTNIGQLNNATFQCYTINPETHEVDPEIGQDEAVIFKLIYLVYYYGRKAQSTLGALAFNSTLEVSSDGATVRKVNRNEVAKNWIVLQKDSRDALNNAKSEYRLNKQQPLQVKGLDDVPGYYRGQGQVFAREIYPAPPI